MTANDLPAIQNAMAEMASIDNGSLILSILQNAVAALYDDRNMEDKAALE